MELLRSLGLIAENPESASAPPALALGLGPEATAAEFTDLFEFQLYPYASVYLGAEGMMGGEARDRIAGFWRALGETPPPEPDHLTVLLAAYAELAEREAQAGAGEAGSRWRHARTAFLWEHLLSWLPVYLDKVGEIGSTFYGDWGRLLRDALIEEAKRLPGSGAVPLHLREAPVLGDLADAGGKEFLRAITTPVRVGMILTRSDLERCARGLGLGLRKGERRYALQSLIGQAPREALEWLAGEADRWAEAHTKRDLSLSAVSAFWQARAATTSSFLRKAVASLPSG